MILYSWHDKKEYFSLFHEEIVYPMRVKETDK